MGHTEMVLAVAGLDEHSVNELTRTLATGCSTATPAERAAYDFAIAQAKDPASVSGAAARRLARHFLRDRARQLMWWASRCHYMTQVADAFQIPLETENPFWSMPGAVKPRAAPVRRKGRRSVRQKPTGARR